MDRKKANIILRIFMAMWILFGLVILTLLICNWPNIQNNVKYVINLLVALPCTLWLGAYIWKHGK